jgi:hypothetical protein
MAAAGHPAEDAINLQLIHVSASIGASRPLAGAGESFGGGPSARTESMRTSCEEAQCFKAGSVLLCARERGRRTQNAGHRTQDAGRRTSHDCLGGSSTAGSGLEEEAVCTVHFPRLRPAVTVWLPCRPLATV